MSERKLNSLQTAMSYHFRDPRLLEEALTHSSLAYELASEERTDFQGAARISNHDNERLEFLGDAILGLAVAEILFRRLPEFHEGEWTRLRANLVSRRHMAQVASALQLGEYLRLGRGEEKSGGRTKTALLANAVEAVIAAIYLDGGFPAAAGFVSRFVVAPYLDALRGALTAGIALGDHKSALQELLQSRKAGAPRYVLKAESGPDHRKRFLVEVRIPHNGSKPLLARGIGTTKKRAEQEAARRAYEKLRKRQVTAATEGGR